VLTPEDADQDGAACDEDRACCHRARPHTESQYNAISTPHERGTKSHRRALTRNKLDRELIAEQDACEEGVVEQADRSERAQDNKRQRTNLEDRTCAEKKTRISLEYACRVSGEPND